MKVIFTALALCLANLAAFAQDDAQKFANTITGEDLKRHLTIVAGAEMEGRETGTEGQRKAAAYIESQFKMLGLQSPSSINNYQQPYQIFKDSFLFSSLKIGKKNYVFATDFINSPLAIVEPKLKAKKIVFAGYGIDDSLYNDYTGKDVKGKIVVFISGEPKKDGNYIVSGTTKSSIWTYPGISGKVAAAKKHGALAAFVINPALTSLSQAQIENARKTSMYFPGNEDVSKKLDYITILPSLAKNILGEVVFNDVIKKATVSEPLNTVRKETKAKTRFSYTKQHIAFTSTNVIGYIEGSDKKDEYVFLTAHYDHLGKIGDKIYYGADDDGSGTVSVLEMAEAFSKAKQEGKGPRRSVVFMTVSGEEKGLWGSEYYSDHPIFPLDKTTVDLNTDMVGRVDTERKTADSLNYVYVIGHNKLSSELPGINEAANDKSSRLSLDYKFDDPNDRERIYYRSDHYNFAKKGVPVLFFYDGMLMADYHKPTDTVDKINFELMEKRVHVIFLTAWEIANRDSMLKRDIPLPKGER